MVKQSPGIILLYTIRGDRFTTIIVTIVSRVIFFPPIQLLIYIIKFHRRQNPSTYSLRALCSRNRDRSRGTIAWTHLTFMLTSSSSWSMCKLDTHRRAASASSSSTSTLSSLRIFTVVTFPYRQNRLNTRSQLTGTRSSPCTRSTLLGSGAEGRASGAGSESPLAPKLRGCPWLYAVSTRLGPPMFLQYWAIRHPCPDYYFIETSRTSRGRQRVMVIYDRDNISHK